MLRRKRISRINNFFPPEKIDNNDLRREDGMSNPLELSQNSFVEGENDVGTSQSRRSIRQKLITPDCGKSKEVKNSKQNSSLKDVALTRSSKGRSRRYPARKRQQSILETLTRETTSGNDKSKGGEHHKDRIFQGITNNSKRRSNSDSDDEYVQESSESSDEEKVLDHQSDAKSESSLSIIHNKLVNKSNIKVVQGVQFDCETSDSESSVSKPTKKCCGKVGAKLQNKFTTKRKKSQIEQATKKNKLRVMDDLKSSEEFSSSSVPAGGSSDQESISSERKMERNAQKLKENLQKQIKVVKEFECDSESSYSHVPSRGMYPELKIFSPGGGKKETASKTRDVRVSTKKKVNDEDFYKVRDSLEPGDTVESKKVFKQELSVSEDSDVIIVSPKKSGKKISQKLRTKRRIDFAHDLLSSGGSDLEINFSKEGKRNCSEHSKNSMRKSYSSESFAIEPRCPSTRDEITDMPLDSVHICWISPNRQTRQCFNLETLKKVALAGGKMTSVCYLQPPHFRTPMEADMIDQIMRKFGRRALSLVPRTPFKKNAWQAPRRQYQTYDVNFRERLDKYMRRQMGSSDLYCCPLCFSEAERQLKNNEDDDEKNNNDSACEFKFDPMTVLHSVDNEFSVAASFCFTKVALVKKHLRSMHNIDSYDLDGNGLFKRFQVRASDGLLQRWLKRSGKSWDVCNQHSYWASGFSFDFTYLHHIVGIHEELGESANPRSYEFSRSISTEKWEFLSGPYLRAEDDDCGDFVVGDECGSEEEVENDFGYRPRLEDDNDIEQGVVEELRRRMGKPIDSLSENEEEDSAHSSFDEEASDISDEGRKGYSWSGGEEEDPWLSQKKKKFKKGRRQFRVPNKKVEQSSDSDSNFVEFERPKLNQQENESKESLKDDTKAAKTPQLQKRRLLVESSDDDGNITN